MSFRPLAVVGAGAVTGLALNAPASFAALRARLDNFKETRFIAPGGSWIIASEAPLPEPWRGMPRQAHMLAGALRECLDLLGTTDPETVPVLYAVAEQDRPGRLDGLGNPLFHEACNLLGVQFHEESRVFADGRVAGAMALHLASQMIHGGGFDDVIVAGVDSYLVAETLGAYAEAGRLMTEDAMNGFFPGEAAAAIVLAREGGEIMIASLGFGLEKATIMSEEPLRGDGMTKAYADALSAAGLTMAEIGYRISSLSGEQYGFKQAALASQRLLRGRHDFQDLWHPADGIGEIGAAAMPLMLGFAADAAAKGYDAGEPVLLEAANDDGRCTALIAQRSVA